VLALAALAAPAATREEDLAALRARIGALRGELEEKEGDRREARDALRASESAISEANRALRGLDAEARAARAELGRIAERRRSLEESLAARQASLGRLLAARRAGGAPEFLRLALSGEDPSEIARKLHYLAVLSRAAAQLIESQRAALLELAGLREEAASRTRDIGRIEAAQRADRERILAERRERRKVLERVAVDIRKTRREMRTLLADEQRLARLVEEIGRVLQARPGAGYTRAERLPERSLEGSFSSLRGKLGLPVRGSVAGVRKGVFIRAPEGEPVRAVAAGRVVYADWMRGLGNLLIVDHGEAYMSIYGNNESLLKQPGDEVRAGDTVATVGASGGNEQTGLYFELRHLGNAFDPLQWVQLK